MFDGIFAQEFVHEHRLVLTDAIGAVGGLGFGGRIPPRVVMNHSIGCCKIQSGAASFERDQKQGHLAALEFFHQSSPVFAAAGENQIANALLLQVAFDDCQHAGELRE